MKKTLNINLGGLIFHIDEDAFQKLEVYLGTLRKQFQKTSGGEEILSDVENRMAELFRERTGSSKEVINLGDVDEIIAIMGKPEDYLQEEVETGNFEDYHSFSTTKKMHRDIDNRIIGGVASGLGAYFNINPIFLRVLFLIMLFTGGFGLLLYLILWAVMPAARTTAEKLQMRGKPVTLNNIESFVKKEGSAVGQKMTELSGKSSTALGNLFAGLFKIIRLIFKFLLKAIGFFFLGIALIVLGSLVLSFFVGVEIDGTYFGPEFLQQSFDILSLDNSIYNSVMIGLSLIFLGPLLLLIYYGLRIIFGIEPLNSAARKGLVLVTIAGLITLIVSGGQIAREFSNYGYQTSEQVLVPKNGMIYFEVRQDSIYKQFDYYWGGSPWRLYDGVSYFRDVELNIKRSRSNRTYLATKVSSQGRNRDEARRNARSIDHYLQLDTGLVMSGAYFTLAEGGLYRSQSIEMTLYLAEGDTVYLGQGTEKITYDIDNVQNYWDPDMTGHFWAMTERGLFCTDCPETEIIEERWEEENDRRENEDFESEVKIRDGFIEIEEKEAFISNEEVQTIALMLAPEDQDFRI